MTITVTNHRYLNQYQIEESSTKLIIGTIHPHLVNDFVIDFFYGNVGSFWSILSEAFPNRNFNNRDEIINTLKSYNVSITDMISKCSRENEHVTQDSKLFDLTLNIDSIKNGIIKSKIDTIFFTSRFGKNNAAKLFTKSFDIRYDFNLETSEFYIPESFFGRKIRCVVLFSPSNNANVGISKSKSYIKNKSKYEDFKHPIKQFKIDFYREKFSFFNN